jgi:hypothetical protein
MMAIIKHSNTGRASVNRWAAAWYAPGRQISLETAAGSPLSPPPWRVIKKSTFTPTWLHRAATPSSTLILRSKTGILSRIVKIVHFSALISRFPF